MTVKNGLYHLRFRDKLAAALHHDYSGPVSGHDEVDITLLLFGKGRIGYESPIHPAHSDCRNRTVEGNIGDLESC